VVKDSLELEAYLKTLSPGTPIAVKARVLVRRPVGGSGSGRAAGQSTGSQKAHGWPQQDRRARRAGIGHATAHWNSAEVRFAGFVAHAAGVAGPYDDVEESHSRSCPALRRASTDIRPSMWTLLLRMGVPATRGQGACK